MAAAVASARVLPVRLHTAASGRTAPSCLPIRALPVLLFAAAVVCTSAFSVSSRVTSVHPLAGTRPFHLLQRTRMPSKPQIPQLRLRGGNLLLKSRPTISALRADTSKTALSMSAVSAPEAPVEKFRKDYQKPDYTIDDISLTFKIEDGATQVPCFPSLCWMLRTDVGGGSCRCSERCR